MRIFLLLLLAIPSPSYLQDEVRVRSTGEYIEGVVDFELRAQGDFEQVCRELSYLSLRASRSTPSLNVVEIIEQDSTGWLVRHRYEVGFSFLKDVSEMIYRYDLTRSDRSIRLEFNLVRSLDGKVPYSSGYWEMEMLPGEGTGGGGTAGNGDGGDGAGGQLLGIRYHSVTRYQKSAGVELALRLFFRGNLKGTIERMLDFARQENPGGSAAAR